MSDTMNTLSAAGNPKDTTSGTKDAAKDAANKVKDSANAAKEIVSETGESLKTAGSQALDTAGSRIKEQVSTAKSMLADAQFEARKRVNAATETTDEYVRDNPWQSVGIALGLGILIGVLAAR